MPDPAVGSTDADGRVRAAWTLGAMPGRQRLYVSVDHVDSALVVVAEAEPVASNTKAAQIGDAPTATAGTALPQEIGLRLTDSTGRALSDIPLAWVALDGGSISGAASRTDSLGEARAHWTLGTTAGRQRIRVQIGSGRAVPPVTLTAIASSGAATAATIASGEDQKATVNALLRKPVTIHVADKLGNPVPGVRVAMTTETGALADTAAVTDSSGNVQARWTLARTAGAQHLTVRVEGIERRIDVAATAVPASAANLALASEVMSGTTGKSLGAPVIATVTDSYGNPVADAPVVFSAKSGTTSPVRIVTDSHGRAPTRWTLGRTPGEQALVAVVKGHDVRGTLTVQAVAAEVKAKAKSTPAKAAPSKTPAKPVAKKKHR
jgi:hypothetical protein